MSDLGLEIGQLLTPLSRLKRWHDVWAVDNGCYKRFKEASFLGILKRNEEHRASCKFVTVPDVVGSARRTAEVFDHYSLKSELRGWPLALVLQDGIEDVEIPWELIKAVFVGGTTDFKMSEVAFQCAKAARILGKWVHVGRVNTGSRFAEWKDHADSCDGSGVSQFTRNRKSVANGAPLLSALTDEQ